MGGGLACALGVLFTPRSRPCGRLAAALFVLLALFTALSIEWSVAPGESWIEANRTFAYLAVFLGAVALGNLGPRDGEVVLRGILVAAAVVVAYALASRVWPAELAELEIYARLGQPYGYWNAVGVTAALALPLALWLGSRREGSAWVNALAYPVAGLLTVALFLTYSRSATLAAVVAIGLWIAFVPLRLRSAAIVIAAGAASAPLILWATGKAAFTDDGVDIAVREAVATKFGLMLLAMVAVLYVAGLGFARLRERSEVAAETRVRIGRGLVALVAGIALLGVGVVAASDRGLRGTLADRWYELRTDSAQTSGGPDRLGSAASSRSTYWRLAWDVFEEEPVRGVGAGGFTTASLRFRESDFLARHAHGYGVQTMADLGLVGLGISIAAVLAWLVAALGAVRAPAWTPDRFAVTALFLAALAYGLQAVIDWTWFVPGPTVMALVAAGFVAGRGPAPESQAAPQPGPRARPNGPRIVLALLCLAAGMALSWSIWQPASADERADRALALSGQGDFEEALEAAHEAQDIDPLAAKPLFVAAVVHKRAGRNDDALEVFQQVVKEHPKEPQAWLRLADFQLYELDEPQAALAALDQALYLDPMSSAAQDSFIEARNRLREEGLLPPEAPLPVPLPEPVP